VSDFGVFVASRQPTSPASARPVRSGPPAAESLAAKELIRAALAEHERLTYLHTRCKVSGITFFNQNVPVSFIVTSKRVLLVDYGATGTQTLPDDAPPRRIKLECLKGAGLETSAIQPRLSGGFVVLASSRNASGVRCCFRCRKS
jgi:hypothetical protein